MSETWRIGRHYDIHVYEADRPVATFHQPEDAARAVLAVNRGVVPDEEFVLLPPRGWLNRVDEVLALHGAGPRPDLSAALGELIRGWAVGLDNSR